jgi:hypothetical protein
VKKISSWAAIGFAPTLVAGIYGMNFQFMPELSWPWGYPFAIGLMIAVSAGCTPSSSATTGCSRPAHRRQWVSSASISVRSPDHRCGRCRLVDALVGVRAEEVALALDEGGGQALARSPS